LNQSGREVSASLPTLWFGKVNRFSGGPPTKKFRRRSLRSQKQAVFADAVVLIPTCREKNLGWGKKELIIKGKE